MTTESLAGRNLQSCYKQSILEKWKSQRLRKKLKKTGLKEHRRANHVLYIRLYIKSIMKIKDKDKNESKTHACKHTTKNKDKREWNWKWDTCT